MVTELKTRDFVSIPEGATLVRNIISHALRSGVKKSFHGASGRELSVVAFTYRVEISDVQCPEFCLEAEIDSDSLATFFLHTKEDKPHPKVQLVKDRHPDMWAGRFVRFMLSEHFPAYGFINIPAYRSWWWKSSDNYQQFEEEYNSNGDIVSAVKKAREGRMAQELGYSEVYPETIHQGEKEHIYQGKTIIEPFILVDFYKNGTPYKNCLRPINPWLLRGTDSK